MRNHAREKYVLYLALLSLLVLPLIKQLAGLMGVAWSLGTATVFGVLFYVFDRWVWRLPVVNRLLAIPDLQGNWAIVGSSEGADEKKFAWNGTATITQTWSKISITVQTEHSRSRSGLAAIERDTGHGFRLLYGYTNEPKGTGSELKTHRGTCEVLFADDLQSAEATYFNDHQRRTCGSMSWERVNTGEE